MKVWCKSSLCYVEPDMEPGEGEEGKFMPGCKKVWRMSASAHEL